MSTDDRGQSKTGVNRRSVLKTLGVAGAVGVGTGTTGAVDASQWFPSETHVPELPHIRGSTEQVLVIGATAESTVSLRDSDDTELDSATTDEFGSYAFRDVEPGDEYSVVELDNGGEETLAESVEVFPEDYVPPQSLYDDQELDETPDDEVDYITMRDGTELACKVQFPSGDPPYPTLVVYDGYAPSVAPLLASEATLFGYATVGVNKRGTQCSGGKFDLWEFLQWLDGYDIVETVATQDWADGIGMLGASYGGYSQFYVAAPQPPSLDAISPGVPVGDFYRDVGWPGGMLNSQFAANWAERRDIENQPFTDDPGMGDVDERVHEDELCEFNQYLRAQNEPTLGRLEGTPYAEDFYESRSPWSFVHDIDVPTLLMVSWQDEQVGSRSARLLERFEGDHPVHFIGANGDHLVMLGFIEDIIAFFSFYLEGEVPRIGFDGPTEYDDALAQYQEEPYKIYWEQSQGNSSRAESTYAEWPPGETWELYLHPDGELGDAPPDVSESSSSYEYVAPPDTEQQLNRDGDGRLIWEQDSDDEHTSFVSQPLSEDHVLVGSGLAELWVSSSADNTDIQVDLIDVRPDGQEQYIQSGWLRASQRYEDETQAKDRRPWHTHLEEDEEDLADGFNQMRIEFHPFAHIFRAGSRVKLAVTNPGGTRDEWAFDVVDETATNEVAHSDAYPSKLELPRVPDQRAPVRSWSPCGDVRHQPCRESDAGEVVLPELVDGVRPSDIDGDGLYEDLTGSGTIEIADVQALFDGLSDPAVQESAWAFNFSGTDPSQVTIFDVQALFSRYQTGE